MKTLAKETKKQINLTKEQRKQIQNRMHKLKMKNRNNSSATQTIIPYIEMCSNGVCWVDKNTFSMTVEFFDTNYELADLDPNGVAC